MAQECCEMIKGVKRLRNEEKEKKDAGSDRG
jgi:hypothetical protein